MLRQTIKVALLGCVLSLIAFATGVAWANEYDAVAAVKEILAAANVGEQDWPQSGGTPLRNNVTEQSLPTTWDVSTGEGVLWSAELGSENYSTPVVANGKIFVGTNNDAAYLERYPKTVDLGVLLCFDEKEGSFLWQHSSEKLPTGAVNDWPGMGICCSPLVDGERLWYVTSRCEVVCLDTEGFLDDEDDGQPDTHSGAQESDVVWSLDMFKQLDVFPHNMSSCSVTGAGELLFVCTSNGVDEEGELPAPEAPSFICLKKETGEIVWSDLGPGENILHGQWSSPAYAEVGGAKQVIFGGGDGWVYSFAAEGENGQAKLLWKFDCNPKEAVYDLGGYGERNFVIATPVVYDGLVYVALGEDPELGEGKGHLWCIDPSKRGDVSPTLVYNQQNPETPIAHKRLQALVKEEGDFEKPNPNSAAVWHYVGSNTEEFETTMHRTLGSVAIRDDMLFISDQSGLFHCLNAKTGQAYWTYDMFSDTWGAPLIGPENVYVSDAEGDIAIFKVSPEQQMVDEINMESAVYTSPVAANGTLYISTRNRLYALRAGAKSPVEN